MIEVIPKQRDESDGLTRFQIENFDTVSLGGIAMGRVTYQLEWKLTEDAEPEVGEDYCKTERVGIVISGCATAAFPGGEGTETRPGDVFYVPPEPHDNWAVGDEPEISLHFMGASKYAK